MNFFKSLGFLLSASPLIIETDTIFFPYSMLGFTLFILASLFDTKNSPTVFFDCLVWILNVFYIIINIPPLYFFSLGIFITIHSSVLLFSYKNKFIQIICVLGQISPLIVMFYPLINSIFFTILFLLQLGRKNTPTNFEETSSIIIQDFEDIILDSEEDTEITDIFVSEIDSFDKNKEENVDYVIPKDSS